MKRFYTVVLVIAVAIALLQSVMSQSGMEQQPMSPGMMMPAQMMQPRMMGQPMFGQPMQAGLFHEDIAALLGLTSDELFTLCQEGKNLTAIVEKLGASLEDVTVQLVQARNDRIKQALTNGTINQVQAERMKARSEAVITAMMTGEMGLGSSANGMNMTGVMPCPYHSMLVGPGWSR
jgi:hypothetical protein